MVAFLPMDYDAVVVGSGPNGLAAAIRLARNGLSVLVLEAADSIGGGTRTKELTAPGFHHDVCSAVMPFGQASPAFRTMPLGEHGLTWLTSDIEVAQPLDDHDAAFLYHDVSRTAGLLGSDGNRYEKVFDRWVSNADQIFAGTMGPLVRAPRHPIKLAGFGLPALMSADRLASRFATTQTRALYAGCAAHAVQPFDRPTSAAVGLALMLAGHASRWAIPQGGASAITTAMANYFVSLGGTIETDVHIDSASDVPPARLVLLSVTPTAFSKMYANQLPANYGHKPWRYGPGVFKIDWALDGPIPWSNPQVGEAATVHVGGRYEDVRRSEHAVHAGQHPERPFVLLAQPTNIDPSRAPNGKHVAWGYCHVPNGSTVDMTDRIEAEIERFAPGFRDLVIAKHVKNPAWYETYNENYVGGDIGAGAFNPRQLFGRPKLSTKPHGTPLPGVFLCGASTAPGGGVHGMSGWWAAQTALTSIGIKPPS